MLPFIGRLPVNSQIRDINYFFLLRARKISTKPPDGKRYFTPILTAARVRGDMSREESVVGEG
jgi:hypothetical protein